MVPGAPYVSTPYHRHGVLLHSGDKSAMVKYQTTCTNDTNEMVRKIFYLLLNVVLRIFNRPNIVFKNVNK